MEFLKLCWDDVKLDMCAKDLKKEEEEAKVNGTYESRKEEIKIARRKLNRKIKTHKEKFYWYDKKREEEKEHKLIRERKQLDKKNN